MKTTLCKSYISLVTKLIDNHGPITAVKLLKSYQNFIIRNAMELPCEPIEWCATDKSGWPKKLKPFKNYVIAPDPLKKSFVISIFRSFDLLQGITSKNTESISDPFNGDENILREFTVFCKTWGENLLKRKAVKPWNSRSEQSVLKAKSTSGPNGSTSTLTLVLDAVALSTNDVLRDSLLRLARHTCSADLIE
jgi:hypothetical protein